MKYWDQDIQIVKPLSILALDFVALCTPLKEERGIMRNTICHNAYYVVVTCIHF